MKKIFVQATDPALFEALAKLEDNVELCPEFTTFSALEKNINGGDLVFLEHIPAQGFYNSKAIVIVVGDSGDKAEEFAAAKAGAYGFICPDLPDTILTHVINCVSKGEIWMTRETIARVFEEYTKLMATTNPQHK